MVTKGAQLPSVCIILPHLSLSKKQKVILFAILFNDELMPNIYFRVGLLVNSYDGA
jgi:hypothetical protein